MRRLTTEEFIKKARELYGDKYDYSNVVYINNHTPVKIYCKKCNKIFEQTPNSHLTGRQCSHCYGSEKYTNETFAKKAKEIHGDKYDYSYVEYVNNQIPIKIKCNDCGTIFWQRPANHFHGQGCPKCGKKSAIEKISYSFEEVLNKAKEIHGDKYDYSNFNYINITEKGIIKCKECGNEFEQSMNSHINQKAGCPYCAKQRLFKSRVLNNDSFIEKAKEIHGDKYDYSKINYVNYDTKIEIICPKHGSFFQSPDSHLQGRGCSKCSVRQSKNEDEIANFIQSFNINVKQHYRKIIQPYEIDIFMPQLKIGIEYNGLLWHSNKYKEDKKYHLNKTIACKNKGITLIHIFEDEYINHKDIVLSKICHILGKTQHKNKIYGRKCLIKNITYKDASTFLDKNHIQGKSSSTIYLGAYYNEELIAVMNFKKEKNNNWELTRFASLKDYICVGVGGKLFSYFVKNYSPEEIKSFADRRWTINEENNIYIQLGFKFDKYINPDYHYYKINGLMKRLHKFGFRKEILHKKYGLPLSMTENEMASALGYYKIYDCGLIKYIWKKEK